MRRFLSSAWLPLCMALVLAGATAGAFAMLKPTGADVDNASILNAFRIAGWAAGPVAGVLALVLMLLLNGIRRLVRLRSVGVLHPVVVLAGLAPWAVFGWQLVYREPRYTAFGRAAIDFVGAPLWWGSVIAIACTLVLSLPLLFSARQKK